MAVVADSACDLPADEARRAGVEIVPLTVSFGTESFLDGVELPAEAFWERVGSNAEHPTTSSPSPEALGEAYEATARRGARGVVSVHLSGGLSRTVETARLAAARAPVPVEVVDSRFVSLAEGLVALVAARAAASGPGLEEVAAAARSAVARIACHMLLDTVDFLKRGGRVGRAKAAMSDLLRIRPVLSMEDGEPVLVARARTRSRALEELLARSAGPAEAAAVMHAGAPEAQDLARAVEQACGVAPLVSTIGAVTGTHMGPRALGVAVLRGAGG